MSSADVPELTKINIRTYIDPVLAELGAQIEIARQVEANAHNMIVALERKQRTRIDRIFNLGPLRELGYPTVDQRSMIAVFEAAINFRNQTMVQLAYSFCIEGKVHQTNYLYEGREPIMAAYARVATMLTQEAAAAQVAAEESNDDDQEED